MKIRSFAIGLLLVLSTQLLAWAGPYEQCIKDNLEKAKNEAAVNLLKEICAKEAAEAESPCKSKQPTDFTDQEICKCLGLVYDAVAKKCK